MPATPVATADSAPRTGGDTSRWYVLAVLFLVLTVNFMDRQILAILLEPIKRELGASDTQMGVLTGFAFVAFFALASVPIARAADRSSRRNIIVAALTFWSAMTMVSGYVVSFLQLAAARVGLGISEAAAAPAAQSMIADLFSRAQRTAALALLAVAGPVGTMAAFTAGGVLNQAVGWRMTMVVLGMPGLLLAIVLLVTVREPRRGASEVQRIDAAAYDLGETIGYLWSLRSLRWLTAGASLNLFAAYATIVWSAPFLIRVHGMTTEQAGAWLGITTGAGGIAGTVLGGIVIQRLARNDPRWMLWGSAVTSALAAPFTVLFLTLPSPGAPAANFGAAFFGPCMLGPVLALTQTLAKVGMRARAAALVGMTFNLVGAGLGPFVVGVLSDVLARRFGVSSIRYALLLPVTLALIAAAISFGRGARHIAQEVAQSATPR